MKNSKKPKNITELEIEESENYFSASEYEINDMETTHAGNYGENCEDNCEDNFKGNFEEEFEENHEENLEEKFEEPYFNENSKLNQNY